MQVAFEKGSHYFWSVSKDKMLKYWDGDKVRHSSPPQSLLRKALLAPRVARVGTASERERLLIDLFAV